MKTKLSIPFFLFLLAALGFVLLVPAGADSVATAKESDKGADEKKESEDGDEEEGGDFFDGETSFTDAQVTKAIKKGVSWLKRKQQPNGSWGETKGNAIYGGGKPQGKGYGNPAGTTALALYALLKCKESIKDPVIKKGFKFLDKNYRKPGTSYETSMLLLAVTATADKNKTSKASKKSKAKLSGRFRKWAQELKDHLVDKQSTRGWRYNHPAITTPPGGAEDLSSTQLVSLALFAAQRLNLKTKNKVWEDILSFSLDQQEDDGPEVKYKDPVDPKITRTANARGFSYIKKDSEEKHSKACGSMTACGIGNIEMVRFILTKGGTKEGREKWNKRADSEKIQNALYDGIAWLEKNWSSFENPPGRPWDYHLYWMYSLERSMDLLSLKLVGSHNWYNEMGQELLNRQREKGFWNSQSTHLPHDTLDTCFALLFLKRSTAGSIPFGSITGGSDEEPVDNR